MTSWVLCLCCLLFSYICFSFDCDSQELNDLVQLFINIGESIPHHRERLERLASLRRAREAAGTAQTETELLSILDSCKLSLLVSS